MTARQRSIPPAFGRRLQREREARHWSLREAAEKCGFAAASTIMRAENGSDVALSSAIALATLYGVPLSTLLAESVCETCDGIPPAGFSGTLGNTGGSGWPLNIPQSGKQTLRHVRCRNGEERSDGEGRVIACR